MPAFPARSTGSPGTKKGFDDVSKELVMNQIPHELAIGGIFLPPLLVAGLFGTIATAITIRLLDRCRLAKYFFYPPLIFLALAVVYTSLIGTVLIPF
jgi:hypothetical protein